MNYFAHGRHFVDRPYLLAGTAVPDWLGVCDRKARVRRRAAAVHCEAPAHHGGCEVAELAEGIVRHHDDDDWFHRTGAFFQVSGTLSTRIRDFFPDDLSMRAGFLGHILTEMLLDAVLIARDPSRLGAYYAALDQVDPERVQSAVNAMNRKATDRLAPLVREFRRMRFLEGYGDDDQLVYRLNQVMRRVRLATLPGSFCSLLSEFREIVAQRADELLAAPKAVYEARFRDSPELNHEKGHL